MESNMTQQSYMPPQNTSQPEPSAQQNFIQDPSVQNFIKQNTKSPLRGCFTVFIILAILLIFFIFGSKVFGIFNLENVYHFIFSIIVIFVLYVIGLIVASQFIKYPHDLLSLVYDRLRG
jgi:hypothetical protein